MHLEPFSKIWTEYFRCDDAQNGFGGPITGVFLKWVLLISTLSYSLMVPIAAKEEDRATSIES